MKMRMMGNLQIDTEFVFWYSTSVVINTLLLPDTNLISMKKMLKTERTLFQFFIKMECNLVFWLISYIIREGIG